MWPRPLCSNQPLQRTVSTSSFVVTMYRGRSSGDRADLPLPAYRGFASYRARHAHEKYDRVPAELTPSETTTSEAATEREPEREPRTVQQLTQITETNESMASSSAHVELPLPPPEWPPNVHRSSCDVDVTICPACNEMCKTADWVNHSRSPRHLNYVADRRASCEDALRNPQDTLADAHEKLEEIRKHHVVISDLYEKIKKDSEFIERTNDETQRNARASWQFWKDI